MRATPLLGFCECSDGGLCHPGSSTRLQTHASGCGAQDGRQDSRAHRWKPLCTSTELRGAISTDMGGRGSRGAARPAAPRRWRRWAGAGQRIWTHCSLPGQATYFIVITYVLRRQWWHGAVLQVGEARHRLGQALELCTPAAGDVRCIVPGGLQASLLTVAACRHKRRSAARALLQLSAAAAWPPLPAWAGGAYRLRGFYRRINDQIVCATSVSGFCNAASGLRLRCALSWLQLCADQAALQWRDQQRRARGSSGKGCGNRRHRLCSRRPLAARW